MEEVIMWLRSLGMEAYAGAFKKYKYDDMDLIRELNDEEISEMIDAIGCISEQASSIRTSIALINEKEEESFRKMDEVKEWLNSLELGRFAKRFQAYKYDDLDLLISFNDAELQEMFTNVDCKPAQAFTMRNSLALKAKLREEEVTSPASQPQKKEQRRQHTSIDKMKTWSAKKIIKHINTTDNFYDLLGITPDVTPKQLKKAYRTLALKVHPDKLGENADDDAFKKLDRIYKCLSNPIKKDYYDKHEEQPVDDKVGKWVCEHCFVINKPVHKVCRMCKRGRNGAEFTNLLFKVITIQFEDHSADKWGMRISFLEENWVITVEEGGQADRSGLVDDDLFLARNGEILTDSNRIQLEELIRTGERCKMTFRHETEKVKNEKKWAKKDIKTIALRITEGYTKGDRIVLKAMRKNTEKNGMYATILKFKSNGKYNIQLDDGTLQTNIMTKFFRMLPKEEENARYEQIEKKLEVAKTDQDKHEEVNNFLNKLKLTRDDIAWKLWKSGIRDRDCRRMGYFLHNNLTLTILRLDDNEIHDQGAQSISEILKYNSTIVELNLSGNKIADVGAEALGQALKTNSTLKKFDIRYNPKIGPKGSQSLSNVIAKNTTIQIFSGFPIRDLQTSNSSHVELYQVDTGCGDTEGLVIGLLLRKNSSLTDFRLTNNAITDKGFWLIGKALRKNSTLTKLALNENEMEDNSAANIGLALKYNRRLMELDLSNNKIGNKGAKAIGDALIQNTSLTELRMTNNLIGDIGTKNIAFGLKINSTMKSIHLSRNNISDGAAEYLVLGLRDNQVIEQVYLQSNTFTDWGKSTLEAVKLDHPSLVNLSL